MLDRLKIILLSVLIGVLTIWGTYADRKNDQARVVRAKSAPERITTQGLLPPAEYQSVTSGKVASSTTYWVMVETDDWILLNGPKGTSTCDAVLGEFGYVNAPQDAMSLANVRLLAAGFKDKELHLDVFVPHFRFEPADLDRCIGFSYDLATGTLRVGNKRLAYLAPVQPALVGR